MSVRRSQKKIMNLITNSTEKIPPRKKKTTLWTSHEILCPYASLH